MGEPVPPFLYLWYCCSLVVLLVVLVHSCVTESRNTVPNLILHKWGEWARAEPAPSDSLAAAPHGTASVPWDFHTMKRVWFHTLRKACVLPYTAPLQTP